jgi:hypothetical protein
MFCCFCLGALLCRAAPSGNAPRSPAGGVATILAALLHDAPPQGLGPVRCVALGPAAVLSAELAEAAAPFTTSVILGRVRLEAGSAGAV